MAATAYRISFTVGARQLVGVERRLVPLAWSLEDALEGRLPRPPPLEEGEDGYRVLSVPLPQIGAIGAFGQGFLKGTEERFNRSYIDLSGSYAAYMARFSGKTRATLRRKQRKFEAASGGALDLRAYRTPDELDRFLALALPLSRRTYQARLLDAGLPEGAEARRSMLELAERDAVRAFLLCRNGAAEAYLYLPVEGDTLVYAHLGHAPEAAALSPGTVLQLAALEQLFAEQRFRYFDFTEGAAPHKTLFATGSIACASFVLLRPTFGNRLLLGAQGGFDRAIGGARSLAEKAGIEAPLRRLLRG